MARSTHSDGWLGRRGTVGHDNTVNMLRFDVLAVLRGLGYPDAGCVVDGSAISSVLAGTLADDRRAPDAILSSAVESATDNDVSVLVEVGQFVPSKWPEAQPVIHIGFNHRVSLVNGRGAKFEHVVILAVREVLRTRCERCRQERPEADVEGSL